MHLRLKFLLFLGVIFIGGCDLFTNEQSLQTGKLIPLAVGNYWEYESTYLDVLKDTIRYEVTAEVQVPIGDTSYTAYAANFVPFPPDLDPYYWLRRNGAQGLYTMGGISDTDTLLINELEYKLPSEVGETIQSPQLSFSFDRFEFYISDTLSITLIDDNREIVTSAGKFECFVYKFKIDFFEEGVIFTTWDYYLYYSTGIGLIAQISTQENNENDIKEEMYLIDYRVQ